MKPRIFLSVIALLASMSACANETLAATDINQQLIGSWNCHYNSEENGSKISIKTQDTYVPNGRSSSFGVLKVRFSADVPEMEYSLAGSANWKVSEGYLTTTFTDLKIVNVSHPEFDKIINLQGLFPNNISDSSKILELSDSKLSLKIAAVGQVYNCNKKLAQS